MRAGSVIAALRQLPFGSLDDLTGGQPFLVLSPHPDDETLGCGGLLCAAAAAGIPAHVLILTDGSASHPLSPSHPAKVLSALRRREALAAITCLGLDGPRLGFLDLKDAATPASGPPFEAAVDEIVRVADVAGAESLFVTWGRDPHCDHETAAAMARAAAARLRISRPALRLWEYPVWGLHLPEDTAIEDALPHGFRFDITTQHDVKRRAIACYASQMTDLIDDDPSAFRFTAAQLAPFTTTHETYIRVAQ